SDSASSSASGSRSERSASGSGSEESEEPSDSEEEEEEEKKKRKTKPKELMKPVPRSESEQSSEEEVRKVTRKVSKPPPRMVSESESEEEDEEDSPSDSSQSESEDSESEAEVKKKKKVTPPKAPAKPVKKESKKEKKEMSLLDFDDFEPTPSPQVTPVGNFLSSSLVTDLEGLSLTDAVLSPAVRIRAAVFRGANVHDQMFMTEQKQGFIKPKHNERRVTPLITWHGFSWGDCQGLEGSEGTLFWLVEAFAGRTVTAQPGAGTVATKRTAPSPADTSTAEKMDIGTCCVRTFCWH
ncbi:hypothetical protein CRUP_010887, partial [Coryphaenoides rupestris]